MDFINSRNALTELINSLYEIKPLKVEYKDLSKIMLEVHKLNFDHIKKDIDYSSNNESGKNFYIRLPFIDESSLPVYQKSRQTPPSGFYSKVRPSIFQKGLGIVSVIIKGFEEHINDSDNRYTKDWLIFSDETNFIYDFNEHVYIQVPEQVLKTTKNKLKKNGLQLHQIKNQTVKEFIYREQKLNEYLSQLKPLSIHKQKETFDLKHFQMDVTSKTSLNKFLLTWKEFLDDFDTWLYLKFFNSQISLSEVRLLQKKSQELLSDIRVGFEKLKHLQDDLSGMNPLDNNFNEYKYVTDLHLKLESTFYGRGKTSGSGFFKVKNDTGTYDVVENLQEIENRKTLAAEKYTQEDIEQQKKKLLKKWNAAQKRD